MSIRKKFGVLIAACVILAVLDLGLTYLATPDLAFKGNPLVRIFGLGWMSLIVANILVFAFFLFLTYVRMFKYNRITTPCRSFREFISLLYYGRPDLHPFTVKIPKNMTAFAAKLSYALMITMFVGRTVAIIEWSLALSIWGIGLHNLSGDIGELWARLQVLRISLPLIPFAVFIGVLLGALAFFLWDVKEYRIYRANLICK